MKESCLQLDLFDTKPEYEGFQTGDICVQRLNGRCSVFMVLLAYPIGNHWHIVPFVSDSYLSFGFCGVNSKYCEVIKRQDVTLKWHFDKENPWIELVR